MFDRCLIDSRSTDFRQIFNGCSSDGNRQMFDRFSIDVRYMFDRCSIDFLQMFVGRRFDRFSTGVRHIVGRKLVYIYICVYSIDRCSIDVRQMFDRYSIDVRQIFIGRRCDRFSIDVLQMFDKCSSDVGSICFPRFSYNISSEGGSIDVRLIRIRRKAVPYIFDRFSPEGGSINVPQMFDRFSSDGGSIDVQYVFDRCSINIRSISDRCSLNFFVGSSWGARSGHTHFGVCRATPRCSKEGHQRCIRQQCFGSWKCSTHKGSIPNHKGSGAHSIVQHKNGTIQSRRGQRKVNTGSFDNKFRSIVWKSITPKRHNTEPHGGGCSFQFENSPPRTYKKRTPFKRRGGVAARS